MSTVVTVAVQERTMLSAMIWVTIGLFAVNAALMVLMIGRPRKPITPGEALFTVVFNIIYIIVLWNVLGAI